MQQTFSNYSLSNEIFFVLEDDDDDDDDDDDGDVGVDDDDHRGFGRLRRKLVMNTFLRKIPSVDRLTAERMFL